MEHHSTQQPAPGFRVMLLLKPFPFAVDLQARTVDQNVQRLVGRALHFKRRLQALATATQGRIIRDGKPVQLEHLHQRPQQACRLPQGLLEHQAYRRGGFDGQQVRINGYPPRRPVFSASQAAWASSVNQIIGSSRRCNAALYSGQWVMRYLGLENL